MPRTDSPGLLLDIFDMSLSQIRGIGEWICGAVTQELSTSEKKSLEDSTANSTSAPSNRCAHVTADDAAPSELGGVSCWRKTWGGTDYCIWHAKESDKPTDKLADARLNRPERIDEAYLSTVGLDDEIDFENCTLWKADFTARLSDANFAGCYLRGADFSGSRIEGADFIDSQANHTEFQNIGGRDSHFTDASLVKADFSTEHKVSTGLASADFDGADLFDASFQNTYLQQADFSDSRLTHVSFVDAEPEQADFDGADVRNADFTHSKLDGAYFADARISTSTDFGDIVAYERIADRRSENSSPRAKVLLDFHRLISNITYSPYLWLRRKFDSQSDQLRHRLPLAILSHYSRLLSALPGRPHINRDRDLSNSASELTSDTDKGIFQSGVRYIQRGTRAAWRFYNRLSPEIAFRSSDKRDLEAAERTYRNYQTILEGTPQKDKQIDFSVREKVVRRKLAWSSGDRWKWLRLALSRWVTKHGESPWRVGFISAGIIGAFTVLYPRYGLVMQKSGQDATPISYNASSELWTTLGDSLYFSVVAFSTLGYGDIQPTGFAEYLAIAETLLGSVMIALLVFVLGRKATQ